MPLTDNVVTFFAASIHLKPSQLVGAADNNHIQFWSQPTALLHVINFDIHRVSHSKVPRVRYSNLDGSV